MSEEMETVEVAAEEILEEEVVEETVEDNGLTDEQLDEIADTAIAALKDVLKYFQTGYGIH